jgi:hypothetical protein
LLRHELDSHGLDVGFACLEPHYVRFITANPQRVFLDAVAWQGHDPSRAEGYVLLGYPKEGAEIVSIAQQGLGLSVSLDSSLACVPIRRIEPASEDRSDDFWRDDNAFYGQVVDAHLPGTSVGTILGMSGGPIFSVRRDPERIRYQLVGVQSTWRPERRIVKGVAIQDIEARMQAEYDLALKQLRERGEGSAEGSGSTCQ